MHERQVPRVVDSFQARVVGTSMAVDDPLHTIEDEDELHPRMGGADDV
jgi:hypothetical protein